MLKQITVGINHVPKILKDFCDGEYDAEKAYNVALTLGSSTTSYDDQVLGGRMLIYISTRSCPDIGDYVNAYRHRLNKETANFMLKHQTVLTRIIAKNRVRDYMQNDFFSAACTLKQYLLCTSYDEESLECIQIMHLRQAVQLYHKRGIERVLQSYEQISQQWFTHASPTIFNSGTKMHQLASCFLIQVGDFMDDISGAVHTISEVSKMNGGVGIQVGNLRHSQIGDVGVSEGPCGFLSIYDKTIGKISQGGKRNGAGTAFLQSWHRDFAKFVKMTDNFGDHASRLVDLNTCAWMDDLLYARIRNAVLADEAKARGENPDPTLKTTWTMFCPKKANSLIGLYGIDFIREYEKLEEKAITQEKIYQDKVLAVKTLHTTLLSSPTDEVREKYLAARMEKVTASKQRIDHDEINAYQLYKSMISIQTNSGMPYMMNGDACQKSNQKNLGSLEQSNLCLEIIEVTRPATPNFAPVIAACNLGSMNIPKYVKGKIKWEEQDEKRPTEEYTADLVEAFDFEHYGEAVGALCQNLNETIDANKYPLDEKDGSGGPISDTNFETRPIGIGVSGQSDAVYLMDIKYESKAHIMFNKMLYACKYFNALVTSLGLAARDGEYESFRTEGYRMFVGKGEEDADADGMKNVSGSPLSNGKFQFDMWKEDAAMQKAHGMLNEKIYDVKDDEPLDPSVWGQKTLYIYCYNGSLVKSLDFEVTSTRREVRFNETEIVVEPTWEALRELISKYGVRNSLLIALMPTASSANILRNCESTEAHQSMIYARDLKSGNYTILVRHVYNDLTEIGMWSSGLAQFIAACEGSVRYIKHYIVDHYEEFLLDNFNLSGGIIEIVDSVERRLDFIIEKYKTMYEISQKFTLKMARQRGVYVCQSQSLNIYLRDPHPVQMEAIHIYANSLRLKTGMYYLRQSPAKSAGDFTLPASLVEYVKNLLGRTKGVLSSKDGKVKKNIEQLTIERQSSAPPKIELVSTPSKEKEEKRIACSIKNKEACIECQA
jgi:ribonucleotide reductase alpha subunit